MIQEPKLRAIEVFIRCYRGEPIKSVGADLGVCKARVFQLRESGRMWLVKVNRSKLGPLSFTILT
jgi:hypothetical protein